MKSMFARLQLDTIENCLRLYSKPGDVVMDPFNGIGSTGYQAVKMLSPVSRDLS
jgi:DNA modification methylase